VVGAPLVAVVSAPAGVQQLVGQVQDLVIQNVAVQNVVPEIPMEVEDEDAVLQRLFFKKYGRALPEQEKEKESDVDNIKFVIDLTDEKDEEMEVATSNVVPVAVVKTEPIEIANVSNVINAAKVAADRKERRELVKGRKALVAFGKTLRKTKVIPEKEAPEVSADSVKPVETVTVRTAEQAEMDADEKEFVAEFGDIPLDEFDDESEFRLYGPEDVLPSDDEDNMINDV
jgi:glycerol-3-phosphate O-acyltransferase